MGRSERTKGAAGEREVAAIFRRYGFDCERTPNSGGLMFAGDLTGDVPAHVEVKRQEVLRLPLWIAQAETECPEDRFPLVVYRTNRMPWRADLSLETYVTQLRYMARFGGVPW